MSKIGYTAGVFDLFHIGHLNILRRAKLECDYLIVGVSTDELCQKRKGKNPIIPYVERIEIIKSIKFVDEAIPQNYADKFEMWNKLKFDIIFVGDDWKGTSEWVELENKFNLVGVKTRYFPYTYQKSSTMIRKTLEIT